MSEERSGESPDEADVPQSLAAAGSAAGSNNVGWQETPKETPPHETSPPIAHRPRRGKRAGGGRVGGGGGRDNADAIVLAKATTPPRRRSLPDASRKRQVSKKRRSNNSSTVSDKATQDGKPHTKNDYEAAVSDIIPQRAAAPSAVSHKAARDCSPQSSDTESDHEADTDIIPQAALSNNRADPAVESDDRVEASSNIQTAAAVESEDSVVDSSKNITAPVLKSNDHVDALSNNRTDPEVESEDHAEASSNKQTDPTVEPDGNADDSTLVREETLVPEVESDNHVNDSTPVHEESVEPADGMLKNAYSVIREAKQEETIAKQKDEEKSTTKKKAPLLSVVYDEESVPASRAFLDEEEEEESSDPPAVSANISDETVASDKQQQGGVVETEAHDSEDLISQQPVVNEEHQEEEEDVSMETVARESTVDENMQGTVVNDAFQNDVAMEATDEAAHAEKTDEHAPMETTGEAAPMETRDEAVPMEMEPTEMQESVMNANGAAAVAGEEALDPRNSAVESSIVQEPLLEDQSHDTTMETAHESEAENEREAAVNDPQLRVSNVVESTTPGGHDDAKGDQLLSDTIETVDADGVPFRVLPDDGKFHGEDSNEQVSQSPPASLVDDSLEQPGQGTNPDDDVIMSDQSPKQAPEKPRAAEEVARDNALSSEGMQEDAPTAGGTQPRQGEIRVHAPVTPPDDQFYVEETAWKYYNPPMPMEGMHVPGAVPPEELQPLPPAPPVPEFPHTGKCTWSFDETSRVLLGDFNQEDGKVEVTYDDEKFLLHMMERDDLTVISDGLASELDPELYDLGYIVDTCGDEFFHKFRRFDKEEDKPKKVGKKQTKPAVTSEAAEAKNAPSQSIPADPSKTGQQSGKTEAGVDMEQLAGTVVFCRYQETDESLSMKVVDFASYVAMRQSALCKMEAREVVEEPEFRFVDHDGKEHVIDVTKSVLYMIDFDVVKLLPKLYEALLEKFELPGCLPGGLHCMMNSINVNGRPFMGPNAYCTPPESFTQVHQDGHGTVDSGHLCLMGFNEVIMLRRMMERHKIHALSLLRGEGRGAHYDGLYDMPHGDDLGEKPDWPLVDGIEACRRMNYYPSVFVLKPGQLVHINKGRLHAFRKMSPSLLPERDCHSDLRKALLAELDTTDPKKFLCFSIAWDWMFRGVTSEGIGREVIATLECAILNRLRKRQSLAIPELALLQMARTMTPMEFNPARAGLCSHSTSAGRNKVENGRYMPSTKTVLRGILPGLRYVVNQHTSAAQKAEASKSRARSGPRVTIAKRPNSWENPQLFALDPYGNTDFFCKLCSKELSNVYMHCDGCEVLLSKDFNICVDCHAEGLYKANIQMHPSIKKKRSLINHTGNMAFDRGSCCPCKNGPACPQCGFCHGCSCKCHQWFTLNRRFFNIEDENSLVERVVAVVGDSPLSYTEEVMPRLEAAAGPVPAAQVVPPVESEPRAEGPEVGGSAAVAKRSSKRPAKGSAGAARKPKKQRRNAATKEPVEVVKKSETSRRRRRQEPKQDPAATAPKAAAKKKAAKSKTLGSNYGAPTAWNSTMLAPLLSNFDVSQRPDELRPLLCLPSRPSSRDDMSNGALAFTEPKGHFPLMDTGGIIHGFQWGGHEALRDFLDKARELTPRTPSAMMDLLPDECKLTEHDVRNLFRNYADTNEIRGIIDGSRGARIAFSLREMEIMLYGRIKNLTLVQCQKLMSYRRVQGLLKFYTNAGEWSAGFEDCEAYRQHLEDTVGLLFRLENAGEPTKPAAVQNSGTKDTVGVEASQAHLPTVASLPVTKSQVPVKPKPKAAKRKFAGIKVLASNWGAPDEWNSSMLQPLLRNFDVSQRPDELRPPMCSPSRPLSRDDISDEALAFTEPKGNFPPTDEGGCIGGFQCGGHEALCAFLDKARVLTPRTPSAMMDLLPDGSGLTEDDVRNLFRNFADAEIRGKMFGGTSQNAQIALSMREVEIILYCHMKNKLTKVHCRKLISYRPPDKVTKLYKDAGEWCGGFEDCEGYKQHLEETVGLLFSLEEGESVAASLKEVTPDTLQPTTVQNHSSVEDMVGVEAIPNQLPNDESLPETTVSRQTKPEAQAVQGLLEMSGHQEVSDPLESRTMQEQSETQEVLVSSVAGGEIHQDGR